MSNNRIMGIDPDGAEQELANATLALRTENAELTERVSDLETEIVLRDLEIEE